MDLQVDEKDSNVHKNQAGDCETGYPHVPLTGHALVARCIAMAVCTKNRNSNDDDYEKGVISPYKSLQLLEQAIEKEQREPTSEEMRKAIEWLGSIFNTKKVPVEEQQERFEEIFTSTGTGFLLKNAMTEAGHR